MAQYSIFIAITISCFVLLFLHVKTPSSAPKWQINLIYIGLISTLISCVVFGSGFLVYWFGKSYTYKNVPPEIKVMLDQFVQEAKKRGVDYSKIDSLNITYLPWQLNGALYAGSCDKNNNTISIPTKNISTLTIFHELGHCLLGLEHLTDSRFKKEIMYVTLNDSQKLDVDTLDNFFNQSNNSLADKNSTLKNSLLNPLSWLVIGLVFSVFYDTFIGIWSSIKYRSRE